MKNNTNLTIKITLIALMASMCAVLGFIGIDFGNIKITFESLPILVGALMFGYIDAIIIALVGTFIYQFVRYGLELTTILWILPYIICALIIGIIAKKSNFSNTKKQLYKIIVMGEVIIFVFNTIALILDSKIHGYFSYAYIGGAIPVRLLIMVIKSIIFSVIIPKILVSFSRITNNGLDKIKEYRE